MKQVLKKIENKVFFYTDGKKCAGKNPRMWGNYSGLSGNCTDLWGNCTGLQGDCSDLWGDCSDLWGNCTGLQGDCSGLQGNIDNAELTDNERKTGVDIQKLVKKQKVKNDEKKGS